MVTGTEVILKLQVVVEWTLDMQLVSVRVKNFRCYSDEIQLDIGDITGLIGLNDCGKSALLEALAIFFEEQKLDSDDGCLVGDKSDVQIICEFNKLPTALVIDADHPTDLNTEHLLNDNSRLEIRKVYDGSLKTPKARGIFAHAIHPTADGFNDLLTMTNRDLKQRAGQLGVETQNIDERINTLLRRAIWAQSDDLQLAPSDIPLDKEAAGKIWDQLRKELPAFALFKSDRQSTDQDNEAQEPMAAAVKEAVKAKEEDLKEIADFVHQKVKIIADDTIAKLSEMAPELAAELNPRFATPTWDKVFKISLTGDEDIPINKRGSGFRRLLLINFFRAQADRRAEEKDAPAVIYAVEEPETSQHPKNQRMIMDAFSTLAEQANCQVILTTHTPVLAKLLSVEGLRYIRKKNNGQREIKLGDDETFRVISNELGVLPDHSVKLFLGVEGPNDINFFYSISKILRQQDENIPDLESLEADGKLIIVPVGGQNLALWTSRLQFLNLPEIHIFDRDTAPPTEPKYQVQAEEINARENCKAFITAKLETENYIHPQAIKAVRPDIDVVFSNFDDVPVIVAAKIHALSESPIAWNELDQDKKRKKISAAKSWLNRSAATEMTVELLDEIDDVGEVRSWFEAIRVALETGSVP